MLLAMYMYINAWNSLKPRSVLINLGALVINKSKIDGATLILNMLALLLNLQSRIPCCSCL